MTRVDQFVDKYGWQIVALLVSATVAWTTLKSQVATKADVTDVARVERKVDALLYLVCKQYPNDSACKP